MSPVNIYTPLKGISRTIEGEILNYFCHRPYFTNPVTVAREINRSRTEVGKAIRHLETEGILRRNSPNGRQFGLLESTPMGTVVMTFGRMPRMLADSIGKHASGWQTKARSVVLAGHDLAEMMGTQNLVLVMSERNSPVPDWATGRMSTLVQREFNIQLDVRSDDPEGIASLLADKGIDPRFMPVVPSTLGNHTAWGLPLDRALIDSVTHEDPPMSARYPTMWN